MDPPFFTRTIPDVQGESEGLMIPASIISLIDFLMCSSSAGGV